MKTNNSFYWWKKPLRDYPNDVKEGDIIDLLDYVLVYIHSTSVEEITEDYLEELFQMLDDDRPNDYHSFSPCSGDLITFNHPKDIGYVVNIVGFKKVKIKNVR